MQSNQSKNTKNAAKQPENKRPQTAAQKARERMNNTLPGVTTFVTEK